MLADKDTEENPWIENTILFVADLLHNSSSEEEIIKILLGEDHGILEENLPLILVAAKMIYKDEVDNYLGD